MDERQQTARLRPIPQVGDGLRPTSGTNTRSLLPQSALPLLLLLLQLLPLYLLLLLLVLVLVA